MFEALLEIFEIHNLGSLQISLLSVLPELFLFLAISVLLLVGSSYSTSKRHGYPMLVKPIAWITIFALGLAFLLVINNPVPHQIIFSGALIVDNFTNFVKAVVLLSSIACLAVSLDYIKQERIHAFEYSILILFAVVGMLLLVSSYDLITLYLAIEMVSLSSYVLATFKRQSAFSTEAGLKYFILGAFSSGLLLFGSSMVYGLTGTTNFGQISQYLSGTSGDPELISTGLVIGVLFIGMALLFKATAAPFHMWAPDVYEGAPTIVSTFFAVVPKIAILGLFIRLFMFSFYDLVGFWQQLLVFSSLTSMVLAALIALKQRKLKRFFCL